MDILNYLIRAMERFAAAMAQLFFRLLWELVTTIAKGIWNSWRTKNNASPTPPDVRPAEVLSPQSAQTQVAKLDSAPTSATHNDAPEWGELIRYAPVKVMPDSIMASRGNLPPADGQLWAVIYDEIVPAIGRQHHEDTIEECRKLRFEEAGYFSLGEQKREPVLLDETTPLTKKAALDLPPLAPDGLNTKDGDDLFVADAKAIPLPNQDNTWWVFVGKEPRLPMSASSFHSSGGSPVPPSKA